VEIVQREEGDGGGPYMEGLVAGNPGRGRREARKRKSCWCSVIDANESQYMPPGQHLDFFRDGRRPDSDIQPP